MAIGAHALIYTSQDSGVTWRTNAPVSLASWNALAASADGIKLVAAGPNTAIYTSTDSGTNWIPRSSPSLAWKSAASSADGNKLAVTYGSPSIPGGIYTSSDAGSTWVSNDVPRLYWISIACSADGTRLVAAPQTGTLYTSGDAGVTWTPAATPSGPWVTVRCSADGSRMAGIMSTGSSALLTSSDSGATWLTNNCPNTNWACLALSADASELFLGSRLTIFTRQTTPAPLLSIVTSTTNALISWIVPSIPFHLEQSPTLPASTWNSVSSSPQLNFATENYEVSIPATNTGFLRLRSN